MNSPQLELIFGIHAVRALLQAAPQRLRALFLQSSRHDERSAQLEQLARAAGCQITRVDARWFETRLGQAVHQGVAAQVVPLPPWGETQLLEAVAAAPMSGSSAPLLLALDGVQDPHNLGACLRSANACGAMAVIVPKDRAAPLNATARKVAAGAAEFTPLAVVTNLSRTLQLLKEVDVWSVGADAEAPTAAHEVDLTGRRVLVMGAEGSGLRSLTRRNCDWLARLPLAGAVESLNVSVATGMLLYEAVRQRAP